MKRTLISLGLFALVVLSSVHADTSQFYPVRVDVVKIYQHSDGYGVVYRKGSVDTAIAYIPIKWFTPGGKAELITGEGPAYPYMVVYYKDGKFDHVKLYVQASPKDPSWGILAPSEGVGKFDGDDIKLEF
jgi:hypothetical protein